MERVGDGVGTVCVKSEEDMLLEITNVAAEMHYNEPTVL
jgi:hypothetical protein